MDQSMFNIGSGELIYFSNGIGIGAYNIKFSRFCWSDVSNLEYCNWCTNSVSDCFGCSSLHRTSHRIFNKQFAPAEYESLKARIKAHMRQTGEYGQFFPTAFSFFGYNETLAQYNFPLTADQAHAEGFEWRERPMPVAQPDTVTCVKTGRPFRLMKPEVAFYAKHGIPTPNIHPDERFMALYVTLGPFTLGERTCSKCARKIETVYTDPALTVYCEECYIREIF